jgi:hypothetical protein
VRERGAQLGSEALLLGLQSGLQAPRAQGAQGQEGTHQRRGGAGPARAAAEKGERGLGREVEKPEEERLREPTESRGSQALQGRQPGSHWGAGAHLPCPAPGGLGESLGARDALASALKWGGAQRQRNDRSISTFGGLLLGSATAEPPSQS